MLVMAKRTKQSKEEIVKIFYGINSKTFEVESVSLTRGAVLTKFGKDLEYIRHPIAGRDARTEVVIVFHLTEIFSVSAQMSDAESTKKRIEELEAKAMRMKAEAAAMGAEKT
jgi:hypothetical protein